MFRVSVGRRFGLPSLVTIDRVIGLYEARANPVSDIIVAIAAAGWWSHGFSGMAFGAALVLLLFACILLHELGHALAARYYGVPVRDIVLLPIGGIAFLGRTVRNPMQELVIAAAGPAVNVAILAVLVPVCWALGVSPSSVQSLRVANETQPSLEIGRAHV